MFSDNCCKNIECLCGSGERVLIRQKITIVLLNQKTNSCHRNASHNPSGGKRHSVGENHPDMNGDLNPSPQTTNVKVNRNSFYSTYHKDSDTSMFTKA